MLSQTCDLTSTRCLRYLMLLCLVSAGQSSPRHRDDHLDSRETRTDDVNARVLQTLLQRQASTIDRLQTDLAAYRNQGQSDLSQVRTEMTAYKNQLNAYKTQMDSMRTQMQAMQHKIDAASKSVAFSARISHKRDHNGHGLTLGEGQTVVFDSVITNIGNAYDNNDGIFTPPVSGTYVFSLQLMAVNHQHHDLYLAIVKNGHAVDLVYAQGKGSLDTNDQGSSQVTTHLTAGDHVWVRHHGGEAVRGGWWTVFSGFLLQAD